MLFISLIQHFGMETDVARHLAESYGDRAWVVGEMCQPSHERFPLRGRRLSKLYTYVDGEVRYAARHEFAQTAVDIIARRTRLAFLNARAAHEALPTIIDIMGEELKWTDERRRKEWMMQWNFWVLWDYMVLRHDQMQRSVPKKAASRCCYSFSRSFIKSTHRQC